MSDPVPFKPLTDDEIEEARQERVRARIEEARAVLADVCKRLKLHPVFVETRVNGAVQQQAFDFVEAK
jgi:predicted DNA-binding ArsR family transcriptional regulator